MSTERSSADSVTLPLQELQRLAAALPMQERCDLWRRTLERDGRSDASRSHGDGWDGCLRALIEQQAEDLQTLLQALVPLHDPLPIWITQGQRELAERDWRRFFGVNRWATTNCTGRCSGWRC